MSHGRGILIAIEGLDGVGKSHIIGSLKARLNHPKIVFTREPYTLLAREEMRDAGATTVRDAFEIVMEDRQRHVDEVILPDLDRGCLIITDRYYASTAVYQASTTEGVPQLYQSQANLWPRPDLWIYVAARSETIIKRTACRKGERIQTPRQIFQRQARYGSILLDGLMGPSRIYRNDRMNDDDFSFLIKTILYEILERVRRSGIDRHGAIVEAIFNAIKSHPHDHSKLEGL